MIERKERVSCKKGIPPKKTKEQLKKVQSIWSVHIHTYNYKVLLLLDMRSQMVQKEVTNYSHL